MSWKKYYTQKELKPSPGIIRALQHFNKHQPQQKTAIDLGCGSGRDTMQLLAEGWTVFAIDNNTEAIELVQKNCELENQKNLVTACVPFREIEWQPANLVNACLSLPFCNPNYFSAIWHNLTESILPDGLFTRNFFGIHDDWNELFLLSKSDIDEMFNQFDITFLMNKNLIKKV